MYQEYPRWMHHHDTKDSKEAKNPDEQEVLEQLGYQTKPKGWWGPKSEPVKPEPKPKSEPKPKRAKPAEETE